MTRCPTCHVPPRRTRRPILVGSQPPPPECPDQWHYPSPYVEEIAS